ncbi:MAG TPA: chromosome segregation protein SMC [Candidatus Gastranaerophilaceae bacterium]|nr:chromosome segregation protein SMC [Candidatus Gastranaerophilaceae bacterium]
MYIKQLEIDNFKSFANKMDIPLLKGFTTISGPNGSGKSNIIDAVLFALGLSTSRTLRAEKLFHLISTHTKRNDALVKVTFGGVEGGKDLVVGRKIKKSSQGYISTYYLDDKVVTLSEIHSILEKHNITPNSYNVIMQGDVTSITNCSSNERRKIIDEIAGVADFDRRIEQATNELETVEKRVEKSSLILSEVDIRLEQLKEEREVALKYQKLKDEKINLESQINKVKFFDIKRNLEKAHENILEFTKKKKEEEVKHKDLEERLELIKGKYQEICELVKEKGEAQQIEIKKLAEETKGAIERKQSAINYADKQIHDGLKSIENAKNGIEVQNKKIADTELKIQLKKDEIKGIEENIALQKAELNKILEEMTGLNQTADQHIEKRNQLRKDLEALQDKENNLIKEKLPLENELKNLQKELGEAQEQVEKLKDFKKNFGSNKDLISTQSEQLKREMEDLKIVQQNAMHDLDTTKNEISDLNYDIQMAYRKISSMEAQKQAVEDANFGRAIDTVMNAKLKGVHAPLVKLGKVDKKYSTALEIAIGGRITHVVVDDEHVASVAIELLKSSDAGRATFIPLNKISKAPSKLPLPKDKGVIDYAINLIDFEDKYTNAFFYALGDTLVVDNLDCAKKLMGRFRVVTLDGEIVEKSGSMTGGSVRKTGLKFSQNDDEELDKFRAKLKEMEKNLASLENKKIELEKKLDSVRSDYSNTMTEYNKANIEVANLVKNSEDNENLIAEKLEFIKLTEPQIEQISKKLDKMESSHVEVTSSIQELQSEIERVEKLINEEDLKNLKEKTESTEFEIKRLNTNLTNANNDLSEMGREIAFFKDLIKTKEEEIKNIEQSSITLEQDKKTYAEEIKVLQDKLDDYEKQIEQINEKLGELLAQRDQINSELLEMETQKHLHVSDLERIAEQIESFKARRRELEPQLELAREELESSGLEVNKLEPVTISIEEITAKIQRLEKRMEDLGLVNMRALTAYDDVLARQQELKEQIETLSKERKQILERMQGYENLKKETFMKTFNSINEYFKEVFHKLSEGEGTLILENEEDPLSGGLTIEAQPRDKKKQRLEGMSGGEKSLTALAFVFAIQKYMPAPFYAFDEVDMHLDGINVEKLSDMIKHQAENTQFIVVSLRKPMIESANRTIGVTQKEKGITRVTGVKLRE